MAPGVAAMSEWNDGDRFWGGIALYQAGKAPLLVFTGGWSPGQPNAKPEGEGSFAAAAAPTGEIAAVAVFVGAAAAAMVFGGVIRGGRRDGFLVRTRWIDSDCLPC